MAFKSKDIKSVRPNSPEELYAELPRTQEAVKGLWVHQGDVLRAYEANYADHEDVALELPTGTGKTLPGLIIAEWTRRGNSGPVAYACPTNQLAGQVIRIAVKEGIPAVLLTGEAKNWPIRDQSAYEGGEAIAITNYSSVFNSSPKLGRPRILVLDDAHAGDQFVGDKYGIDINRRKNPMEYQKVLTSLSPYISGLQLQRLQSGDFDPGALRQVQLITPLIKPEALNKLDSVLAQLQSPHNFELAMIRNGIASCVLFLSYGGIQIRPMTPPTFENTVFANAKQRLYLSATLGSGGELERSFGRSSIARLSLQGKPQPRSGRRLFVFPDMAKGEDADALVRKLVSLTHKAIVLTPGTTDEAKNTAASLAASGVPVFAKEDVEHGLDSFVNAAKGILGLANRYDGLDLPDNACRMVVLAGLPNAYSLQERFLSERADAKAALAERVRTRVIQGAGRCTRGPNDFAVVIVTGSDITRYLARPDIRAALDTELQAEVEFGWENSKGCTHDEIIDNVKVFLRHEQEWRENGEQVLAEYRRESVTTPLAGSAELQLSAVDEVEAWNFAFQGIWGEASARMQRAARIVGKGGDSTRGYRALLLYLSALWLHKGATSEAELARARALVREAGEVTTRGIWLREMVPLPKQDQEELSAEDSIAVGAISSVLSKGVRAERYALLLVEMLKDLSQTEASPYERGLTTLGTLLGAESFKPERDGHCDSAWLWGNSFWITIEAKTERGENGSVPLRDIRQTNTQLGLLATERGLLTSPPSSVAVIVSARLVVDPRDANVANPNVYLTAPEAMLEIARDVKDLWDTLIPSVSNQGGERLKTYVADLLGQSGCLPSQVKERLTENPIRPLN